MDIVDFENGHEHAQDFPNMSTGVPKGSLFSLIWILESDRE